MRSTAAHSFWSGRILGHYSHPDKQGFHRSNIRPRWWLAGAGRTFRDVVFPACDDIPVLPVPADLESTLPGYAETATPVFMGHYWLAPDSPRTPVTTNVVCLDYSVARGGPLVAYRWNGAGPLADAGFVTSEWN